MVSSTIPTTPTIAISQNIPRFRLHSRDPSHLTAFLKPHGRSFSICHSPTSRITSLQPTIFWLHLSFPPGIMNPSHDSKSFASHGDEHSVICNPQGLLGKRQYRWTSKLQPHLVLRARIMISSKTGCHLTFVWAILKARGRAKTPSSDFDAARKLGFRNKHDGVAAGTTMPQRRPIQSAG